jgi:hypothetical protein
MNAKLLRIARLVLGCSMIVLAPSACLDESRHDHSEIYSSSDNPRIQTAEASPDGGGS